MKKLTIALAAGALVLGSVMTIPLLARAEIPAPGASSFHDALKNSSPIVHEIACAGYTGIYGCGPGWQWGHGKRGWRCYRCY